VLRISDAARACPLANSGFYEIKAREILLFPKAGRVQTSAVTQLKERSAMKVLFKARDPHATELRDLTERRVRFVLRRLGWLVPRAEVQMSDVNASRGGIDKRCQVELDTHGAGSVVVSAVANEWRTALDGALARAVRSLMRLWRRDADSRRLRRRLVSLER
jgi:hypothetical protein